MKNQCFRCIFLILLEALCFVCISGNELRTDLVFALFKNGQRSPKKSEIFPHQPFTEEKQWPLGYGQLTNKGKNEMYDLGKLINAHYKSFLGENPSSLAAKSLEKDRCMESTELVAVGVYPPAGEFVWNPECHWQPFAVHLFDSIPEGALNCGNEYDEMKQLLSANKSETADNLCKKLVKYMHEETSNHLNLTCKTLAKISNFYTILKQNKLALPFYVDKVYEKLVTFHNLYTDMKAETECEQQKSARVLFDIKDMIEKHNEKKNIIIKLYGVTSQKLKTILRILEDESDERDPNALALLIDLKSTDNGYKSLHFNALYENEAKVIPVKIRGCQNSTVCTIDEFIDLFKNLEIEEVSAMSANVKAIIVLGVLLAFVSGLLSTLMFFVWKQRSKKKEYQEIGGN